MKTSLLLALLALGFLSGCDRQDGNRLARVGRKVADKARVLVPDRVPFGTSVGPRGLADERVRERFRSDRYLAPQPIDVSAEGNTIRLRGTVPESVLKRRAFEIADSTVGVEKVIDELTVE
jgi:osmotically-inducible protein OsmY